MHSLALLKGASTFIQIKFHNSHVREWTYEIDENLLYLGMLQCGRSGFGGPVLVLKKNTNSEWSMFDYYHDGWKALWERSGEVIDLAAFGNTAAAGGELHADSPDGKRSFDVIAAKVAAGTGAEIGVTAVVR